MNQTVELPYQIMTFLEKREASPATLSLRLGIPQSTVETTLATLNKNRLILPSRSEWFLAPVGRITLRQENMLFDIYFIDREPREPSGACEALAVRYGKCPHHLQTPGAIMATILRLQRRGLLMREPGGKRWMRTGVAMETASHQQNSQI